MNSSDTYIASQQLRIERFLEQHLPSINLEPSLIHQAMRYVVLGAGKRIRPLLVYAGGLTCGVDLASLDAAAASVELIHSYSLVHDDLPALDNDIQRRGKATCHIAFDEATAILVGDSLQTTAFQWLSDQTLNPNLNAHQLIGFIKTLSHAAGTEGMVGGQVLDLQARGVCTQAAIEHIHELKTGALIASSLKMGALACPTISNEELEIFSQIGKWLGLAFQIQDDLLDYQENKPAEPLNYAAQFGVPFARERVIALHQSAIDELSHLNKAVNPIEKVIAYLLKRQY